MTPSEQHGDHASETFSDVPCTVCGCVCDDLRVTVSGTRISHVERACKLAEPWFAEFMQRLGEEGLKAVAKDRVAIFSRLYWFTVEFGMALEEGALKLYGAGLASSFGEAAYALDSARPERLPFDLERVLRTPYRSDTFQPRYFVVDGLETLRAGIDFNQLEEALSAL